MQKTTTITIAEYNETQTGNAKEICTFLESHLTTGLKKSESKIWHGSPVWFIEGNPVISYSVRKDGKVSLLFTQNKFCSVFIPSIISISFSRILDTSAIALAISSASDFKSVLRTRIVSYPSSLE